MFEHQLSHFSLEVSTHFLTQKQTNEKRMYFLLCMYINKSLFSFLIEFDESELLKIQTIGNLTNQQLIETYRWYLNALHTEREKESTVTITRKLTFLNAAYQVTMEILFTKWIALDGMICKDWICRINCIISSTVWFLK